MTDRAIVDAGDAAVPAPAPSAAHLVAHPWAHPAFDQFVATVAALRAPDGCPWDREQTHGSVAHNMIEEAYEAVDAIEEADVAHLREELGDVLLQVVLQSQIASDAGEFTIDDVCADVNAKMVRRHPHVFGEAKAGTATEVLDLWDKVKLAERQGAVQAAGGLAADSTEATDGEEAADVAGSAKSSDGAGAVMAAGTAGVRPAGLLDGVPRSFPALMQAQKISRKAAAAGFEWDTVDDVWLKVDEEVAELKEAYAAAPKAANGKADAGALPQGCSESAADEAQAAVAAVEEELGDVLFALVNVGRRMGVDAESALRGACAKFRRRWSFMESAAQGEGRTIEDLPLPEMEALWQQAKARE